MSLRRAVVTGIGILAPNGSHKNIFWENIKSGVSGIGTIESFDTSGFQCKVAGQILDFDPLSHFNSKQIKRNARFTQFAIVAAKMALEDAGLEINDENAENIGVLVGSGIGGLNVVEDQQTAFLKRGA